MNYAISFKSVKDLHVLHMVVCLYNSLAGLVQLCEVQLKVLVVLEREIQLWKNFRTSMLN